MNLTGIIAISGKPGLYKVIAQGKNNIIVESLIDNKRFPAYATDKISALEDISIYTYEDDRPLGEVFSAILTKQNGEAAPSHKESLKTLKSFMEEILPDYDQERVYDSDIKKLFQWYNLLHSAKVFEALEVKKEEKMAEKKEATKKPSEKKPAAKKASTGEKPKATAKPKTTEKKAPAKKTVKKEN